MKKVQRISKELQQSLGREATPEEIAEKLGDKSTEDVKKYFILSSESGFTGNSGRRRRRK